MLLWSSDSSRGFEFGGYCEDGPLSVPPRRGASLLEDDSEVAAEYSLSVLWLLPGRAPELPVGMLLEKVLPPNPL